jgi:adenine-specific DNA-methyltransferase
VVPRKGRPREPEYAIGDVLDWTYSGNRLGPTQKPLPVLLPLVETFSPYSGLVLDPFAGSGSTLLAARMLGRRFLGIELDGDSHAIAKRRLERESMSRRPSCATSRPRQPSTISEP